MVVEKKKKIRVGGRQKGTPNKVTQKMRDLISDFLHENWDKVKADVKKLPPHLRVKFYLELIQYDTPKIQSMSIDMNFDKLTDEQLDQIIERLKNEGSKG